MRLLLRLLLFAAGIVLLVLVIAFCWVYFYSRDLPNVRALAQYAPSAVTQALDPCLGPSVAVPYEAIGINLRNAISAVETNQDDPGVLRATYQGLMNTEARRKRTVVASWYISRTMCRTPSKALQRHLAEFRNAVQLERHFSRQQLFTIYANRVSLGPDLIGVQMGSEFYFHKSATDLTLPEAALLAGFITSPSYYSPLRHADRALQRRNEVLDAMAENGSIRVDEAQSAKAVPLQFATESK